HALQMQALIDPHADALAEQLLGPNGRTELTGFLGGFRDFSETTLDPIGRNLHRNFSLQPLQRSLNMRLSQVLISLGCEHIISAGTVACCPAGLGAACAIGVGLDELLLPSAERTSSLAAHAVGEIDGFGFGHNATCPWESYG